MPQTKNSAPEVAAPRSLEDVSKLDPNHHLWRNGRLWWVAFTVHLPGWRKERIRTSLGTANIVEARRRRDELLACYPQVRGCELSLRIVPRMARKRRPMRVQGSLALA